MKPDVSPALWAAEKVLATTGHVVVRGPTGSGLHTVLRALAEQAIATVELRRPADVDAAAAALLEAAGFLEDGERRAALEPSADITHSVAKIVEALNSRRAGLALLIGPGWTRLESNDEEGTRLKRARLLLRQFARTERLVVLADHTLDLSGLGFPAPDSTIALEAPLVRLDAAQFPAGIYRDRAQELARVLPEQHTSPLVWRLGVGLRAMGENIGSVAALCARQPAEVLSLLVARLVARMQDPANIALNLAVQRSLLVRRPMSAASLVELTRMAPEHAGLLTSCLGYGDPVRVSPIVRRLLSQHYQPTSALSEAHVALAKHYQATDGAASPADTRTPVQMSSWVERAHHLAAGLARDEWASLELPCPELYWDRGRALSTIAHDYEGAAAVYEECARRFPDDDYSAHYAAYNLARAKVGADFKITSYFKKAVELAPENPWWNHRYIVALIDSNRLTEARRSWTQALANIDPDGAQTSSSTWLVENLCVPVARAWLRKGCWRDARRALSGAQSQFAEHREVQPLLADIEEQAHDERATLRAWMDARSERSWRDASSTLEEFRARVVDLPTPAATMGEGGRAVLVWSLDDVVLELEFGEDGVAWYARERSATTGEGEDASTTLSDALLRWVERVARG